MISVNQIEGIELLGFHGGERVAQVYGRQERKGIDLGQVLAHVVPVHCKIRRYCKEP